MTKCKNKVATKGIVNVTDYQMEKHPVYYVHINNPCKYDIVAIGLGYKGIAAGDAQLIISADEVREGVEQMDEEGGEDDKIIEMLMKIVATLDKAKFDGDVWFYTR